MVGGKDVFRENGDIPQVSLGIDPSKVSLDGAVRDARNLVDPDWEEMARVERGRSPGRNSVENQSGKVAIQNGKKLAKLLVGYTNTNEQKQIVNIIKGTSYNDILYLLKGYKEDQGMGSDDLLHQIYNENGFEEKMNLIRNVIGKLAQYASVHNYKASASYFNGFKGRLDLTYEEREGIYREYKAMAKKEGINIEYGR